MPVRVWTQNGPGSQPVVPVTEQSWRECRDWDTVWLGGSHSTWGLVSKQSPPLSCWGWDAKGHVDSLGPRHQESPNSPGHLLINVGWEGFPGKLVTWGPLLSGSLAFTPLLHIRPGVSGRLRRLEAPTPHSCPCLVPQLI